jgi:hypothetical protein
MACSISFFEVAKWRCAVKDEIFVPITILMINTPKVNKPTLFLNDLRTGNRSIKAGWE